MYDITKSVQPGFLNFYRLCPCVLCGFMVSFILRKAKVGEMYMVTAREEIKQYATFYGGEDKLGIFPVNGDRIVLNSKDEIGDFIRQLREFCHDMRRLDDMEQALKSDAEFDYPIFCSEYSDHQNYTGRVMKIIPPDSGLLAFRNRREVEDFIDELRHQCDAILDE